MFKIFKYSFFDLIRSRWSIVYFLFFFVISVSLLYLSGDMSKVIISLLNIILILNPLIATIFGVMYYYNSREFSELLLAQPIKRKSVFFGQFLGLSVSLSLSFVLGLLVPFLLFRIFNTDQVSNAFTLLFVGTFLTMIFSAIAFYIALKTENKIKGFGKAIFVWLFFAVIYDGIFLLLLNSFNEYPLEKFALVGSMLNPIDLSRILILMKLDVSALMHFTGAVFSDFFGSSKGTIISFLILSVWLIIPLFLINRRLKRKDF